MSKINTIISKGNFEYVRERIAQILAIELANQAYLIQTYINDNAPTGDELEFLEMTLECIPYEVTVVDDVNVYTSKVYEERDLAVCPDEAKVLNVVFATSPQSDLNTPSTQIGVVRYVVETWQRSSTLANERGDRRAARKAQRLLNIVSHIINDPNYKRTLGLGQQANFIGSVNVHNIGIAQPDKMNTNADNEIYGKLDVMVKISESTQQYTGLLALGSDVTRNVEGTENTIVWSTTLS